MIEQKYIDEVLDKVDLTEVAEVYGITLKLKGHRAWACCPFHNEDTASFCIDTVKNLWYCYGCGLRYGEGRPYFPFGREKASERETGP